MLATLVEEPFDDKEWVFETKWDGFRLLTEKRGKAVRLWSRNGIDVSSRYAVMLPAFRKSRGFVRHRRGAPARSTNVDALVSSSYRTPSTRKPSYSMWCSMRYS